MTFDLDKAMKNGGKCQTRDGRVAKITCVNAPGVCPCVGYIINNEKDKDIGPYMWQRDGRSFSGWADLDLVNISEKKEGWINIYQDIPFKTMQPYLGEELWRNRDDAINAPKPKGCRCLATIKIEWDE